MPTIKFIALFGDDRKQVRLHKEPLSGTSWNITIDAVSYGHIFERTNGYWYHDNLLNTEDVQAIVDRITEFNNEQYSEAQFYTFKTATEYWAQFKKFNNSN